MPEYTTGTPRPDRLEGWLSQHSESMGAAAPTDLELLAAWMLGHGLATGHADDMAALICELDWQWHEAITRIAPKESPAASGT